MTNQYDDLAHKLEMLATEFDAQTEPASFDEDASQWPLSDSKVLRAAARRLRQRPCQHSVDFPVGYEGGTFCRWCGVRMEATWHPVE